jgi:DNA (cytosine-5)-methyltransferase 1
MTARAYYNEHDPFAAAWLRELIKAGHIAPGDVDERSIEDVTPNDLAGYTQCHFFAGIGVWSYALRQAGWTDDRPVWTGSCPCQPFSAAGKGGGFADERHLWPAFHWLIQQCQPGTVFGEQVASKDGLAWLDLVQADLEATGYAVGAADICAAGFGAPHIRQRMYWVANADRSKQGRLPDKTGREGEEIRLWGGNDVADGGAYGQLANAKSSKCKQPWRTRPRWKGFADNSPVLDMADTDNTRPQGRELLPKCTGKCVAGPGSLASDGLPGPTNGHWGVADWLYCRDSKWRAVEPGTFPLAHGAAARVGRLRGYGNAIVATQAQAFIEAVMESTP